MLTRLILRAKPIGCHLRRFAAASTAEPAIPAFMDYYNKATKEFGQGHLELSAEFCRKALSEVETQKSIHWRDVAAVQLNLSHTLKLMSDFEGAREMASKALKGLDAHYSTSKQEVCHALDVIAELCCELGDYESALTHVNRALDVKNGLISQSGLPLAKSYNIRGAIHLNEGRLAQARSDFIRALAINVRSHGRSRPLPLPIGITLSNIAGVLKKEGAGNSECIAIYRDVVDSFAANGSDNSWILGSALTDLAESLLQSNTKTGVNEAKELLTRSLHICLSTRGLDHQSTERATHVLKLCSTTAVSDGSLEVNLNFVDTLLNECETILPKPGAPRVSGDILFLDQRGHVGKGHPHTPLF